MSESSPSDRTPGNRLDSWKVIAAYLNRDVRTVQRWERTQRLPVYRHTHNKLSTAYVYKSELDAWWTNQRPDPPDAAPTHIATPRNWRRMAVWMLAAAGAAAAILSVAYALRSVRPAPVAARVEQATTTSPDALRLYSLAIKAIAEPITNNWQAAVGLLRESLAADPDFASAHIWLAWALQNTSKNRQEVHEEAARAVRSSPGASPLEREWIAGSAAHLDGQLADAIPHYEAVLRLDANHAWAVENLTFIHFRLGHDEDGARLAPRLPELRPNRPRSYFWAGRAMLAIGDLPRAREYARRGRALRDPASLPTGPHMWLALFPFYEAWLDRRVDDARNALSGISDELRGLPPGPPASQLADWVGAGFVVLGQLRRAEEVYRWELMPAAPLFFADANRRLGRWRTRLPPLEPADLDRIGPLRLAYGGFPNQAEAVLGRAQFDDADDPILGPGRRAVVRGELLRQHGDIAAARSLLRAGVETLRHSADDALFFGAESLAQIVERSEGADAALHLLQQLEHERNHVFAMAPTADGWLRLRSRERRLAEAAGRHEVAATIDAELRQLLRFADPDHAIAAMLTRSAAPRTN